MTQVGDGRGLDTCNEKPLPSSPLLQRNVKNACATLKCLPPVAAREARDLQNFFPFPRLLEEEKVLELEEEEPFPDEDLDGWESECKSPGKSEASLWVSTASSPW